MTFEKGQIFTTRFHRDQNIDWVVELYKLSGARVEYIGSSYYDSMRFKFLDGKLFWKQKFLILSKKKAELVLTPVECKASKEIT